jgi:hypothetical protein
MDDVTRSKIFVLGADYEDILVCGLFCLCLDVH